MSTIQVPLGTDITASVHALRLAPDDVIVVEFPGMLTEQGRELVQSRIIDCIRRASGVEHTVLIIDMNAKVRAVKPLPPATDWPT